MATVLSKIYENICEALLTSQAAAISVDGKGGAKTVKALQKYLGVKQDGVISGQLKDLKKYHPGLTAVKYGKGGSPTVKRMQQWLGIAQDGQWGRNTSIALQKKLGVTQDGIAGASTFKALQKFLNGSQPAPALTPTPTAQKIVARAKEYAWPYETASSKYSYKKGSAKSVYKSALKKYMGKSAKISQTDCGYFVSTCVRASGTSSSFLALPSSYKKSYPSVPSTMQIVHKGTFISNILEPGDIIRYRKTGGQHVVVYIGDGKIAHASRKHAFPRVSKSKPWNNSNVKKSTIQVIRAK